MHLLFHMNTNQLTGHFQESVTKTLSQNVRGYNLLREGKQNKGEASVDIIKKKVEPKVVNYLKIWVKGKIKIT